ncbi:MAG: HAD family hydrolase [Chloroflexi bacterium]|nr:HAD family hydrolase [Chloroflexota bacterium]
MAPQLNAVLFDFDDTLIDWSAVTRDWRELEAERLAPVLRLLDRRLAPTGVDLAQLVERYTERTRAAWKIARRDMRAPRMPAILQDTLTELGIREAAALADEILRAYDWKAVPGTVVFPDVFPALDELSSRGIRLGVVTNSSQPMSLRDRELRQHGLLPYFPDCRLAAADVGYLKPHPRIFHCALERIGAAPAEAVFIGDNPIADVSGALGVGMRAVQRLNGDCAGASKGQPCLRSFDDLPALLDDWYPGWRDGSA